jgi:oxaloacetate decarboxylase alpha subunit
MAIQFVDTTFRDGSQSLWAAGMRPGMMEEIADHLDNSGFSVIEVPVMPLNFKKIVRDLKEDPWEMARMLAAKMPKTKKSFMGEPAIFPFEIVGAPEAVVKLYYQKLVEIGVLDRVQIMANIFGNVDELYPWYLPFLRSQGLEIALAISYTISPRHTDEYYAKKTQEIAKSKPNVIYLKDQGGLLTVDRIRTLLPIIIENANGIPVEVHSHCTTGLADLVYLEALQLGVKVLHTSVPPLAEGSGQPSVFNVARNAKHLGFDNNLDLERIQLASDRLHQMAKQDSMPIGAPISYDYSQYVYQIPGGVISNLKHQLAELNLQDRLEEVLEETIRVREDLGFPVMITPYSQFVVSQAAINIATGERYKVVIDELIQFSLGTFSEDSGYTWMNQNLKDKILALPRVKQLPSVPDGSVSLDKIREQFGASQLSDEEFLLRYIMKGKKEIEEMRNAGPYRKYFSASTPLVQLLEKLSKQPTISHVQIQGRQGSLILTNN